MILNTEQKPVERVMDTAFTRIKTLVDADTVIGKPLGLEDGTSVIPISRVTLGMLTGGGEYGDASSGGREYPFAGGSGVGASVVPIGFLVHKNGTYKVLRMAESTLPEKILSIIPDIAEAVADAAAYVK